MTKENLHKRYIRWLQNYSGTSSLLFPDQPKLLAVQDEKTSAQSLISMAVYAQCLYDCCKQAHLFIISESITWKLDSEGNAESVAARSYHVLFSS